MQGFLDRFVAYLAKEANLKTQQQEIVRFGLECTASALVSTGVALGFGGILGQFSETLTALLIFALLRRFSGGAHCTAPGRCALFTAVILALVTGQARWLEEIGFSLHSLGIIVTVVIALAIHYRWAPADCPAHPIINPVRRQRLKSLSLAAIAVIASFLWLISFLGNGLYAGVGWVSLLWHSLGITPWGNKAVAGADRLLATVGVRR
ncbi:MAG: accessory gene regulator ArgB-like protein [Bacillota bacterium]